LANCKLGNPRERDKYGESAAKYGPLESPPAVYRGIVVDPAVVAVVARYAAHEGGDDNCTRLY
jgi:hypothetical protein